jgi:hypothetical protein
MWSNDAETQVGLKAYHPELTKTVPGLGLPIGFSELPERGNGWRNNAVHRDSIAVNDFAERMSILVCASDVSSTVAYDSHSHIP